MCFSNRNPADAVCWVCYIQIFCLILHVYSLLIQMTMYRLAGCLKAPSDHSHFFTGLTVMPVSSVSRDSRDSDRDAGVRGAPEGWSWSWEIAGVRGEVQGVFPHFCSLRVQGMRAARRWRHPKTSSCLDSTPGWDLSFSCSLHEESRSWAGQPPSCSGFKHGLSALRRDFFSSLSPSQRERQCIKMLVFPWHRSTQLRGCLAGAWDVNEPRQLTLVWTGGMTCSDAVSCLR